MAGGKTQIRKCFCTSALYSTRSPKHAISATNIKVGALTAREYYEKIKKDLR